MLKRIFANIGCPGCGCGGFFIGAAVAASMLNAGHLDPDSKSWAMLFNGGIPGAIVGAVVFYGIRSWWKDR